MIPEKKRRVFYFFGALYAVLAVALLYLLFFNTGLGAEENPEEGTVYVVNHSMHQINSITVSVREQGTARKIMEIGKMLPGERIPVDYDFFSTPGENELVVEAPFHQTFVKRIVIAGAGAPDLEYEMQFPGLIYANAQFLFSLKVCNSRQNDEVVRVEESHSAEFFDAPMGVDSRVIAAGACGTVSYMLKPKKAGRTTIYFNIKVRNITKSLEKEIEVLE